MPLSPKDTRRFGCRSNTPAPIMAARMWISPIWNADTPVNMAARRTWPEVISRAIGAVVGKVWKCMGICTSDTAFHIGSHDGCHIGSMSQEHDSSTPFRPSFAQR